MKLLISLLSLRVTAANAGGNHDHKIESRRELIIDMKCIVEYPELLGDGFCDPGYNNVACGYDLGDCCPSSCELNVIRGAPNFCSEQMICVDPKAPEVKFPDCHVEHRRFIGDGFCDAEYNTHDCGWDGGDCCIATCKWNMHEGSAASDCTAPMNCLDPHFFDEHNMAGRPGPFHVPAFDRPLEEVTYPTDGEKKDKENDSTLKSLGGNMGALAAENENPLEALFAKRKIIIAGSVAAGVLAAIISLACFLRAPKTAESRDGIIGGREKSLYDIDIDNKSEKNTLRGRLRLSILETSIRSLRSHGEDDVVLEKPPLIARKSSGFSDHSGDAMARIVSEADLWNEFQDRLRESSCNVAGSKSYTSEVLREFVKEKGLGDELSRPRASRFSSFRSIGESILGSVSKASSDQHVSTRPRSISRRPRAISSTTAGLLQEAKLRIGEEKPRTRESEVEMETAARLAAEAITELEHSDKCLDDEEGAIENVEEMMTQTRGREDTMQERSTVVEVHESAKREARRSVDTQKTLAQPGNGGTGAAVDAAVVEVGAGAAAAVAAKQTISSDSKTDFSASQPSTSQSRPGSSITESSTQDNSDLKPAGFQGLVKGAAADASQGASSDTRKRSSESKETGAHTMLERAIKAGDWEALGEAASVVSDASTGGGSYFGSHTSSGTGLSSKEQSLGSTVNIDRASELDQMIDAGDWTGVAAAAGRYSSTDKGSKFIASAGSSEKKQKGGDSSTEDEGSGSGSGSRS